MQGEKALFMDFDFTLLKDDKTISEKNRRAVRQALAEGNCVVAATGRPVASGKKIVKELGLTMPGCYMIAFNGSALYDCANDRIISQATIPSVSVRRLFEEAKKAGIHIQTYNKTHILTERVTDELLYYSEKTKMPYQVMEGGIASLKEEPFKALLIRLSDRSALEGFQRANAAWTDDVMTSFFSSSQYLEYCPYGVDKGAAVASFCKWKGIPVERTVAVGDEWNDISMIKAAHIGVAVKNAVDAAKEAADYVTEQDNNHDAVAEVIERFLLR